MRVAIAIALALCAAALVIAPADAARLSSKKKKPQAPEEACPGCAGVCLFQTVKGACKISKNAEDVSCWYCAASKKAKKDVVKPEGACDCSPFARGCRLDKKSCGFYSEANANPDCWVCEGPPAGACAHDCDADNNDDKCNYFGGCGDKDDSQCYYCKSEEDDRVKAPEGACAECGGADSMDCIVDESCKPLQLYFDPACYECVEASGEATTAAVSTAKPTPKPKSRRRRRRR
eukprot:m.357695 g.357695  ORF g.357695 m.357695 type:complete len:233 (-) comp17903_c0_seq1:358-1056(-)